MCFFVLIYYGLYGGAIVAILKTKQLFNQEK